MNEPHKHSDDSLLPTAAMLVVPIQYVFAVFLLLRGHNLPGGGFIGGLVLASALVLRQMANRGRQPRFEPVALVGIGIICAVAAASAPVFLGQPFFKALWLGEIWLPVLGILKVGTPLLFDIGVFLAVTGVGAKILSVLLSQNQPPPGARKNDQPR